LAIAVSQPLMPQGVEHIRWFTYPYSESAVSQPLMPQGVEHEIPK